MPARLLIHLEAAGEDEPAINLRFYIQQLLGSKEAFLSEVFRQADDQLGALLSSYIEREVAENARTARNQLGPSAEFKTPFL